MVNKRFFFAVINMSNIVIRKNEINNLALTLRERSQLVDPYYLFEFISNFSTTPLKRYASAQNQASVNIRYDLIVLSEQANPEGLDGEIRLMEGEWSYKVYESQEPTLEVSETTGRIIQHGIAIAI